MKIAYLKKIFENKICNSFSNLRQTPTKGFKMYSNDIVEMEDFSFNHFIHHFDECDIEHLGYNEEYNCIEVVAECMEEIIWN